ncbi:MAG: TlpA family protein disulfide reductase [Planctomycetaceae bacterium]
MRSISAAWGLILSAGLMLATQVAVSADPAGMLTLRTGDRLPGHILPADKVGTLRWQGRGFVSAFDFPTESVGTVQIGFQPTPKMTGEYAIECTIGDLLAGRVVAWDKSAVEFEALHFGTLHLRPDSIRRMYRLNDNPLVVFPALNGLLGWKTNEKTWREDGTDIESKDDDALATCDVQLPDQAMLEFELSWTGQPAFIFAVGIDPKKTVDDKQQGWRFEVWGNELTVIREQLRMADVDHVLTLTPSDKRVHLFAYVDQAAGSMHVFLPGGKPAGKVTVEPEEASRRGRGILLKNCLGHVRLEKLRVVRWNGVLPSETDAEQSQCQLADGTTVSGKIIGLSDDSRNFLIRSEQGDREIPVDQLLAADMVPETSSVNGPAAVILQDGTRVSGQLDARDSASITVTNSIVAEPLRVPYDKLRSVLVSQDSEIKTTDPPHGQRVGQLQIGSLDLHGVLVPYPETETDHCLAFQPVGSLTSSPLQSDVAGRVIYKARSLPGKSTTTTTTTTIAPNAGRNFAELFLAKSRAAGKAGLSQSHILFLRSGDIIPCSIAAIDEAGVTIASTVTNATLVPHAQVKAIEFVPGSRPPDLVAAKKARLLTLPRLQKLSPPTQLLCSKTGDFLRGRLVSLSVDKLTMEIHLEDHEIPRDRVSQIIWFHRDEYASDADAAEANSEKSAETEPSPTASTSELKSLPRLGTGLVQAIEPNGNRVTFDPARLEGTILSGRNDVLGDCQIDLTTIDELVLGSEIAAAISDLPYQDWRLTPAVEPLYTQETGGDATAEGDVSPLVGKEAPPIKLNLLSGGQFDLASSRGQIVLLDFWASWCGPCMQTMPLLEEALQGFDPQQVRLVSVNLEEPADHIQSVLERHELHMEVALDVDGVAAHRYQADAIPQLVIVDREGKIVRLFVGGGPQVVEHVKSALNDLLAPAGDPPPAIPKPAT